MPPQLIHQIVGPQTNSVIDACLRSWEVLLAVDFEIKRWTDSTIQTFVQEKYPFALKALLNARNHAEAADIARYLLVHHFGGYYFDWDIQLLNPNSFLRLCERNVNGFLVIDPSNGTLASEAFSGNQENKYLISLVKEIVSIYEAGGRDFMGTPQYSGPFRMREALKTFGVAEQSLIPVKKVFAYDYSEIREMKTKKILQPMIHYWMHSWI